MGGTRPISPENAPRQAQPAARGTLTTRRGLRLLPAPMIRRLSLVFALLSAGALADPVAEMTAFSSLKNVDLAKLAAGEIQTGRGPVMSFPRGLAIESAYVVKAPVAKVLELQRAWSPMRHSELKIWLHGELPAKPALDDFRKIATAPNNGPVKSLIAATEKLDPAKPGLYVSADEAKAYGKTQADSWGGSVPGAVSGFWANVLLARAQAFNAGGVARQPAYSWKGETVSASDEINRLLKEVPKLRAQFSGLAASLTGGSAPAKSAHYWELFDVEGQAALSLGAMIEKPSASGAQAAEVQYYASGGYFAFVTFYQMWPVEGGTLVWRGDLIAAPALGDLRGMERMGASAAMMKQIKQLVTAFLKDAK